MSEIVFFLLAVTTCFFAVKTVTSKNIFHCAVWLSLALLNMSGFYFCLEAKFLGVIQVLVYIGGIITLFIFAIKLTSHIEDASIIQSNRQVIPAAMFSGTLFLILFSIIAINPWTTNQSQGNSADLAQLGRSLVTTYVLPFEFISLVLLAVLIGAIVIGKVKK